jgi:hypothetical protein
VVGKIKGHDRTDGHRHTELTRCVLTPTDQPQHWPERPGPTADHHDRAVPTGPLAPVVAAQPLAEITTPVNLDTWTTGPGSYADTADVAWLADTLTGLANDPLVQMKVKANDIDGFRLAFADQLSDTFMDRFDERADLLRWAYFGREDDRTALERAAAQAIHSAI